MKEKTSFFWAKYCTIGVPLMAISLPLHWMLRGGASLYGLVCKALIKIGFPEYMAALEASVIVDDFRKSGSNWSGEQFVDFIKTYFEKRYQEIGE